MPHVITRLRRWSRVLIHLMWLLGVIAIITFVMAPTLAVWWFQPHLPWTRTFSTGSVTVASAATSVAPAPSFRPDAQVLITPQRARQLASDASGYWLPPGLIRHGQQVTGSVSLPILRPQPFTWQIISGGTSAAPLASMTINNVELTEFLRVYGRTVITYSNQPLMWCTYVVRAGKIRDVSTPDLPPLTRRLWVEARGSIILQAGTAQREVTVRYLAGHATVTYTPDAGGYRMHIQVRIEQSDADEITVPVIGDVRPLLLKQLEKAANDGLSDGLEPLWLPPWLPLDTRVFVEVN